MPSFQRAAAITRRAEPGRSGGHTHVQAVIVVGPDPRVTEHRGAAQHTADPHCRHDVGIGRRQRDPALAHPDDISASDRRAQLPLGHSMLADEKTSGCDSAERGESGKEHSPIVERGA